jgi:hypothetical protein
MPYEDNHPDRRGVPVRSEAERQICQWCRSDTTELTTFTAVSWHWKSISVWHPYSMRQAILTSLSYLQLIYWSQSWSRRSDFERWSESPLNLQDIDWLVMYAQLSWHIQPKWCLRRTIGRDMSGLTHTLYLRNCLVTTNIMSAGERLIVTKLVF